MFQNISKEDIDNQNQDIKVHKKENMREVFKRLFAKQNIVLYIISFMISMVGLSSENVIFSIVPFGLSFIAAALSNGQAIGIMYVLSLLGTFLKFGLNSFLTYFITSLVFFALVLIVRPKLQDGVNEGRKIGGHLFFAVFLVQIVPVFFGSFMVYDALISVMLAVTTYIFYKIFVSSILMIKEFGQKRAFTIEEVMGTSLLLSITISAIRRFRYFWIFVKKYIKYFNCFSLRLEKRYFSRRNGWNYNRSGSWYYR